MPQDDPRSTSSGEGACHRTEKPAMLADQEATVQPDQHPEYWQEYTNLQQVKHRLIERYLQGWFPKMASWSRRLIYIDTHAGRGSHIGGQPGSPIVALKALLNHRLRDSQILYRAEVVFWFIEADSHNLELLQKEIGSVGPIPRRVTIHPILADSTEALRTLISYLKEQKADLAPAFIFVDPYGFPIPCEVLKELIAFPGVELFVNVMWREIDMQSRQTGKAGVAAGLDELFGGPGWEDRLRSTDQQERAFEATQLLQERLRAKWFSLFYMLRGPRAVRYLLLHLSNHDAGRNLMKDCMWDVAPEDGYYVRKSDTGGQQSLQLGTEPDLRPVRDWVLNRLRSGPRRWADLQSDFLGEIWREKHLNDAVRQLRRENLVHGSGYMGNFAPTNNPLLSIAPPPRHGMDRSPRMH